MKKSTKIVTVILGVIYLIFAFTFVSQNTPENNPDIKIVEKLPVSKEAEKTLKTETDEEYLLSILNKNYHSEIPLMYQTDYPHIPYDTDNVAESGCGITSLAMIATYLTDNVYAPDELAIKYNNVADNNVLRMEYGIQDIGLDYYVTSDWYELMGALSNNQPAIILVGSDSVFTDVGHFLIVERLTEDGKIIVKDPNKENYSLDELKEGYKNGFDEETVKYGFFTAWVFSEKEPYSLEDAKTLISLYQSNPNLDETTMKNILFKKRNSSY